MKCTAPDCVMKCAAQVLSEYKRLLALKVAAADFDDEALAAPAALLQMWREHIVDTANYVEHCRRICGRMIHHAPDADMDERQHARRCHRSLALYRRHFGATPPPAIWNFGPLEPLSMDEAALLDEDLPAVKRQRSAPASTVTVSVQAPNLPLHSLAVASDMTVGSLFDCFVRATGSTHLVAGRRSVPPSVRIRHAGMWLHDLQLLVDDAHVKEGSMIYIALPQERRSHDQLLVSVKDVKDGEVGTVYTRPTDAIVDVMRQLQDTLGIAADAQTLIFGGRVLSASDTVGGCGIVDRSTIQMAVGKRRTQEMTMSPGGTWRLP